MSRIFLIEVDDPSQVGVNETRRLAVGNVRVLNEGKVGENGELVYPELILNAYDVAPVTFEKNRSIKGRNKNARQA